MLSSSTLGLKFTIEVSTEHPSDPAFRLDRASPAWKAEAPTQVPSSSRRRALAPSQAGSEGKKERRGLQESRGVGLGVAWKVDERCEEESRGVKQQGPEKKYG